MRYLKAKQKKNFCTTALPLFFIKKIKIKHDYAFQIKRLRYQSLNLALQGKTNLSS
jgi:hypothetical protein